MAVAGRGARGTQDEQHEDAQVAERRRATVPEGLRPDAGADDSRGASEAGARRESAAARRRACGDRRPRWRASVATAGHPPGDRRPGHGVDRRWPDDRGTGAEWSRRRSAATLVGAMPIVEGLSFSYVIHELPRDRLPFRRWRFELWHGARLEAAGWRTTERDASRALRKHGSRVAHGMFGLRPPATSPRPLPRFRPGAAVRVQHSGDRLRPRAAASSRRRRRWAACPADRRPRAATARATGVRRLLDR